MLKTRIIPKLLLSHGRTVKGVRFEALRDVGHPVTNARVYDAQGADELLFLDIAATVDGSGILEDIVTRTASELFMPFCVGGGVRSVEDVRRLLAAGADKVAITTAAVEDPQLIASAARVFGAQCLVVGIDFRRIGGRCEVFVRGGRVATGLDARDHARRMVDLGAGEILLASIDRDGTLEGYDLEATQAVADAVSVPVIASGGAGTLAHLVDAVRRGRAAAVAVGSLFHFTDQSPIKARSYMRGAGIDVRIGA
jgi:cyclase